MMPANLFGSILMARNTQRKSLCTSNNSRDPVVPTLVIIAGPNGSGKTTLVRSGVLSEVLPVDGTSINADDIA
jgi:ABC-type cobalamin/Fe3+-siderophores transport system ATPase subunit